MYFGLDGRQRAELYVFAATTGVRSNEIRQLRAGDFDLGSAVPHVVIPARIAKARREHQVRLENPLVVEMLGDRLRSLLPGARVFAMPSPSKVAPMLRRDLEAASIPYRDEHGHVIDFHGLRGVYLNWVYRAVDDPKSGATLARHADSRTAWRHYLRANPNLLAQAQERMPVMDIGATLVTKSDRDLCSSLCTPGTAEYQTVPPDTHSEGQEWRRHPDSNRGSWICNRPPIGL